MRRTTRMTWKSFALIAMLALATSTGTAVAVDAIETQSTCDSAALASQQPQTTADQTTLLGSTWIADAGVLGRESSAEDGEAASTPTIPCLLDFCRKAGTRCTYVEVRTLRNGKQCCSYSCSPDPSCTSGGSVPGNACPLKGKKK